MNYSILIGILCGVIVAISMTKGIQCHICNTKLPVFRKPTSFRQMLKGGWTCPKCGTEVDKHGEKIKLNIS